jgi:hypothetical protein
MNERIRELLEQAGVKYTVMPKDTVYEKFAELLIKDCAEIVKDVYKAGGNTYSNIMYERYGIKYPWQE